MDPIFRVLSGPWFIVSTNFPMWLDGTKTNPMFNYTIAEKKGTTLLVDEVTYTERGKPKIIFGLDHLDPKNEKTFIWQGRGLLAFVKSQWTVKLIDEENEWAVIWFSKTTFTPEGVDILCRKRTLDESTLESIKARMIRDATLKKHVAHLEDLFLLSSMAQSKTPFLPRHRHR